MPSKNMKQVSTDISFWDMEGPWDHTASYVEDRISGLGIDPATARLDVEVWSADHFVLSGERPMTQKEKAAALKKRERDRKAKRLKALKLRKKKIESAISIAKELGVDTSDLDVARAAVIQDIENPPNGA